MPYSIMKLVHLHGLVLMSAGLIGVWYADLRSGQLRALPLFAEAIRQIAVFYDGLVVPGAPLTGFRHLAHRRRLRRLGIPRCAVAGWHGGAFRFRVHRGEYHYKAVLS